MISSVSYIVVRTLGRYKHVTTAGLIARLAVSPVNDFLPSTIRVLDIPRSSDRVIGRRLLPIMRAREVFFLMPELDGLLIRFAESLGSARIISNWMSFLQASTGRILAYQQGIRNDLVIVYIVLCSISLHVPDLYLYRYLRLKHISETGR